MSTTSTHLHKCIFVTTGLISRISIWIYSFVNPFSTEWFVFPKVISKFLWLKLHSLENTEYLSADVLSRRNSIVILVYKHQITKPGWPNTPHSSERFPYWIIPELEVIINWETPRQSQGVFEVIITEGKVVLSNLKHHSTFIKIIHTLHEHPVGTAQISDYINNCWLIRVSYFM